MSDGDAVETAARALLAYSVPSGAGDDWAECEVKARRVIQALVDGGHYVPTGTAVKDGTAANYRVAWLLTRDERDAAITRAETAEKLAKQRLTGWMDAQREIDRLQIAARLARQAVTREDEQ